MESPEDINQLIVHYKPTHLLRISNQETYRAYTDFIDSGYATEVTTGGRYFAELIDWNTDKTIWKGQIITDEYLTRRGAARKTARKIVADLKDRDFIEGIID